MFVELRASVTDEWAWRFWVCCRSDYQSACCAWFKFWPVHCKMVSIASAALVSLVALCDNRVVRVVVLCISCGKLLLSSRRSCLTSLQSRCRVRMMGQMSRGRDTSGACQPVSPGHPWRRVVGGGLYLLGVRGVGLLWEVLQSPVGLRRLVFVGAAILRPCAPLLLSCNRLY